MENPSCAHDILIVWRGKKYDVQMSPVATLKDLGDEMQKLTNVKADTMRFIVPQSSNKSSKSLTPYSSEHEHLSLQETSIIQGKPIRMMGVSENEVDEILQGEKLNLRIAGFDEEEKRLRQRISHRSQFTPKLPQGPYTFGDFRTLQLPGIELNPPPSEALKRMHMLASDPGIIAIMNKYHWRVGIMTEMAPVGYVGVSPKCILGFNKNQGEEISLRLRTDDLKGFRKYEGIKKTLLHELAHMVYSEHDANFFALDRQLNEEATSLDWTRSTSHTLSGVRRSDYDDEVFNVEEGDAFSQKLGGNTLGQFADARMASVAAAYQRVTNVSTISTGVSEVHEEPDPDDSGIHAHVDLTQMGNVAKEKIGADSGNKVDYKEVDPDNLSDFQIKFEPDPDESWEDKTRQAEAFQSESQGIIEALVTETIPVQFTEKNLDTFVSCKESDHDHLVVGLKHDVAEPKQLPSEEMSIPDCKTQAEKNIDEPDPDELAAKRGILEYGIPAEEDELAATGKFDDQSHLSDAFIKSDICESQEDGAMQAEPYADPNPVHPQENSRMQIDEPDPDEEELRRIQDPVTVACDRLQKAIESLRAEAGLPQAIVVLQTLFKIISNVIEHPKETKFRRLRKANPVIQRTIANYRAAMELLVLIGFNEELITDEMGKAETYLVLKRDDPGFLWLAKSCIEMNIST